MFCSHSYFENNSFNFSPGIRRFIRELEIDGKLYELRLHQLHPGQNLQEDVQLQHEGTSSLSHSH